LSEESEEEKKNQTNQENQKTKTKRTKRTRRTRQHRFFGMSTLSFLVNPSDSYLFSLIFFKEFNLTSFIL